MSILSGISVLYCCFPVSESSCSTDFFFVVFFKLQFYSRLQQAGYFVPVGISDNNNFSDEEG